MSIPLEQYLKTQSDGPAGAIFLADWNGVLTEVGGAIAELRAKAAGFDAVTQTAIEVLLDRVNDVLGPAFERVAELAATVEQQVADLNGAGVSANVVLDTATRVLVSPAQRNLIDTAAQAADLNAAIATAGKVRVRDLYLSGF